MRQRQRTPDHSYPIKYGSVQQLTQGSLNDTRHMSISAPKRSGRKKSNLRTATQFRLVLSKTKKFDFFGPCHMFCRKQVHNSITLFPKYGNDG
jgi:hypothetical protein